MSGNLTFERSDPLLLPFLQAGDQARAEDLLARIIQVHADPIIAGILKHRLRVTLNGAHGNQENQDALEIASDLRASLVSDLRAAHQSPSQKSIASFPDYVAVKTYSACADYLRHKNPQRARLKNLLRYQLKQDPRFDLRKAENNRWYAGLSRWSSAAAGDNPSVQLSLSSTLLEIFSEQSRQDVPPPALLNALFELTGHPIEFDQLVSLAAEFWQITDLPLESLDDQEGEPEGESIHPAPRVDLQLEQRTYLQRLWVEVCELPILQRAALLLNLRDAQGGSAIFFVTHLGIASQSQIAEILGVPDEEFSALWRDLPLDDARIGRMFRISRQQVINLRKTARERLARRMKRPARER